MNRTHLHHATEFVAACFVSLLLSGCSSTKSYVEPPETTGAAAIVEATAPVWIRSIDGKNVSAKTFGDTQTLRVTPGRHELVVNFRALDVIDAAQPGRKPSLPNKTHRATVSQPVKIPIVAKAGHNYTIQFDRNNEKKQVLFWVGEFEDIKPAEAREMKSKF